MCNDKTYLIPEYVFEDIKKSLVDRKSRTSGEIFKMFSKSRFKKNSSEETLQWFNEHVQWTPPFVAVFVKQEKRVIEYTKCLVCGKLLTEKQIIEGRVYCSNQCQTHSDTRKQHAIETNLKRYGVKNPAQNKDVIEKRKKTTLEKYGVEHTTQLESTKQKAKETLRQHYGVDHPMQSPEIKDKLISYFNDTYGVSNPSKLPEVQKKIRLTMNERYGVDYYPQSDQFAEQVRNTCLDRYGVNNTSKLPENVKKREQTMLDRYGVANPSRSYELMAKIKSHRRESDYDTFIKRLREQNHLEIITPYEEYISALTPVRYRCLLCGTEFENERANIARVHCPNCYGGSASQKELELLKFIEDLIGKDNVITSDRSIIKPYELDMVVPIKRLAIEFNGSYWHADKKRNRAYHRMKTDACAKQGYRLIHVFEYEWDHKKEKIKSIIKHALGIFDQRIYARNCDCRVIDSTAYRTFLNENHLQGAISSSIRYGLFYNNELVAVIGFGQSRFKKGETELYRFCVKRGYSVIGGFGKLLKFSKIKHFYTYVDLTHFTGDAYRTLGFNKIGISEPNYVYVKNDKVLSRMACQKHKLPALLGDKFDPTKSEYENMTLNGWNRIYDCGNLKLEYTA